jgi:hypothetical protein
VLGAVSLVLRKPSFQTIFFRGMWLLGLIGSGMSFWAFSFIQNSLA